MKKETISMMSEMEFAEPVNDDFIETVEHTMNIVFPEQYKRFMKLTNGAEGPLGDNSYLSIWPLDEIASLNDDYGVSKFTPGLVYFGSDGGGTAYAFDFRAVPPVIVEFPFDSIDIDDAVKIADTIDGFIATLYQR